MGCILKKNGDGGQDIQFETAKNLIVNTITQSMNGILQIQNKNLQNTISYQANLIRQSLDKQTNYLKIISENIIQSSKQNKDILEEIKKQKQQQPIKNLQSKQQKKLNEISEILSQMPSMYLQKMTEISHRIQQIQSTQFQFIKDQSDKKKQKYKTIPSLNKSINLNQQQKNSALEQLDIDDKNKGNIDYKDRFLVVPLAKYDKQIQKLNMNAWVSDLYEKLSEEAFYGYFHKHITEEQMKLFYSKNLILNTVKMLKFLTDKNQNQSVNQILKKFGTLSESALEFQLKKYPQKKKIFLKPQIQNMIQMCQTNEDPQYDILRNMNFYYQHEENGVYYKYIKLMINKLISLTNQNFQQYRDQMKKVFTLKQEYSKQQKLIPKEYIQHQIGRKVSQNTPQFEPNQINSSNKIIIKSPQILRIIIKWIQELEEKISQLEKNIDKRYFPFPLRNGGDVRYPKQIRQQISSKFKKFLSQKDQHKFDKNRAMLQNIETQMINYINKNSESFRYVSQNNTEVGLATYLLSETVQEIAIKHLNGIIHSILSFQKQEQKTTYPNIEEKQNFSNVNYITFSVYDLLRSKCVGSYQNIKVVYERLKQNPNFKIIRVKNRLASGNRDFLLNMKFKNTPIICELQLALIIDQSNINQKQDRLGHFNHFLYELKRSKYGSLTQAAILNAHYCQSITFFSDKLKKIKFEKQRNVKLQFIRPKIQNNIIQIPNYNIQNLKTIFVCHNCLQVKYTKNCFLNTYKTMKKESSSKYLCGECVLNTLQPFQRNKYLLGDYFGQYFQQTNFDQMLTTNSSYYLIIPNDKNRYIVKGLEEGYFIQPFSAIVSSNYSFLNKDQLGIKYVYRLAKQIDVPDNKFTIHNIEELNSRAYINQQRRNFLIQNKDNWKQAICIKGKGKKGWLLIDATRKQNAQDYHSNLYLFKRTIQIKKLKESKIDYMDLELWELDQKFFQQHLDGIKQIKKLNLYGNNLKDISKIIKGKSILELKLAKNRLQTAIIPIQSLIKLQINDNKLVKVDFSSLINLQQLDISNNLLEDIQLDKLVKLRQLNLSKNQLKKLTLTNKLCQKLNLSYNPLFSLDISKMQNLKELKIYANKFQKLTLQNAQLEKIDMARNEQLTEMNIQKLINLKELRMFQNGFKKLTLKNPKLQYLDISCNELVSINLYALTNLKQLNLSSNKLQMQILQLDNPLLEKLFIANNKIKNIDLSKLVNLKELIAPRNQFIQFPEKGIKSLQKLSLNNNKLKKILLNGYISLKQVNISNNQIEELIVGNLAIQKLIANNNKLKKVDIIKLNKLRNLNLSKNQIQSIVLENEALQKVQIHYNRIQNLNLDKLRNLKYFNISYNCITSITITKEKNPKIETIELNNLKSNYEQYLLKILTKQQKDRYNQQKQKSRAEDKQILIKLKIYPIIQNQKLLKINQQQYPQRITIKNLGKQ